MANIKRIEGKDGVSFKITVTNGRDLSGKQIRHFMTWKPETRMTERQMKKAVEAAANEFERSILLGYRPDSKQTFAEYAEYVLSIKSREGAKYRTIERYRELLTRINPAIGHIKVVDIRPQHLNEFYKNLGEDGIAKKGDVAQSKIDFPALLKDREVKREELARLAGVGTSTINAICQGKAIRLSNAEKVAAALEMPFSKLFKKIERSAGRLSNKTILEHHRLIRTILYQAEKEMIVSYNAATKASPPKAQQKEVNYLQPADITRVLEALENEPIKWRTAVHLLIITGCRRGELLGLKWEKVDFENSQIKIDASLLYSAKRGTYESTTKTSTTRFVKLPKETMNLLRQYRRWYIEQRFKYGDQWVDTGYLFVKENGEPMQPDGITGYLRKFSKKYDLPHINPHAFRHTMASVLINNGQDIVSVSKRLGHAKTSTTTDIYSHVIAEADAKASECLADVMLRPTEKRNIG